MKFIVLSKGYFSCVDDDDFDRVNKFKWSASVDNKTVYAMRKERCLITGQRKTVTMHRFIMNQTDPKIHIDHADGDGLMNCKFNLRVCSNQQNAMNRRRINNDSGFKGVSKNGGKWAAKIMKNKQRFFIGNFPNPEAAARAYDQKAKELFGEFANLNFPNL